MIDPVTLRDLWQTHADRLVLIARSTGEPAEDAVQEAFLALATQGGLPDDPVAWLVRVARNRLLQWRRGQLRREKRERTAAGERWLQMPDDGVDTPIDAADATEALRRLPDGEREIVVMHLWGGLTFEAIGEVIGRSRATAHRRYISGLNRLQQVLDPDIVDSQVVDSAIVDSQIVDRESSPDPRSATPSARGL